MTMKTSTRQVDGVTIVDLSGRITLGEGSVVLRDTVKELLSKSVEVLLLYFQDGTNCTMKESGFYSYVACLQVLGLYSGRPLLVQCLRWKC